LKDPATVAALRAHGWANFDDMAGTMSSEMRSGSSYDMFLSSRISSSARAALGVEGAADLRTMWDALADGRLSGLGRNWVLKN
jgi:deoxyxylulose-5-phosphate synthase